MIQQTWKSWAESVNSTSMKLTCLVLLLAQDRPGLVLADHGKSPYRIVLPQSPLPSEKHAAEELQRIFKEMSGAELPIRAESDPAETHEICLSARSGARDGYSIRTKGDRLFIEGDRPRGVLYAVYALLEDQFGCRWFTRDVSFIPKKDRWELPALDVSCAPPFEYREDFYFEAFDGDWAARQRSNGNHERLEARHGGKLTYHPFVHTFETILPQDKYFKEHPEYYSEVRGKRIRFPHQLCLTNPDVLKLTIECVRGWMKEHPEATIFSVSQNDCFNNCQCAACKAIDDAEGSPCGTLLSFVNKVAEAIEKEFPDKLIDTLAYQYTRKAPRTIRPRANVRVRLCSIECCFAHPLETCAHNKSFVDDIVAWSKITDNLYLWDYVVSFGHYLLPFPNFDVLGPNAQFFAAHGVKGIFEEGAYQSDAAELSELRAYVLAKVLWNPKADVKKAIQEFTDAVYGEAGPEVREYLDLLQSTVRDKPIHVTIGANPGAKYLKDDFLDKAEALFDRGAAKVKDPGALKRLRKARLCLDYLRLVRTKRTDPAYNKRVEAFFAACDEFGMKQINEGQTTELFKRGYPKAKGDEY